MTLKEEIIQHWQSFKNPLINDILINIEQIESSLPPLTKKEESLVSDVLNICMDIPAEHVDEMLFIRSLNQLPAAYMLFLIHKLQMLNQDLIMRIISYAQQHKNTDPEVTSFFQRNMVFEKSQLLGRIFSTSRMENVLFILNGQA